MNNFQNDDYGTNLNKYLGGDEPFSAMSNGISCDDGFLIPTKGDHFNRSQSCTAKASTDFKGDFNDDSWVNANGRSANFLFTPSTFNESMVQTSIKSLGWDDDSCTNGGKGRTAQDHLDEFMQPVEITNFISLAIENTTYIAKLKQSTRDGLIHSGLMPDKWTELMESNYIKFPIDPRPDIRLLVEICNKISQTLTDCIHVAICRLNLSDGCPCSPRHSSMATLEHLRSCRLRTCEKDDCIKCRKVMEHFCSCNIQSCYVCRTLFISIANMCDSTNSDHYLKKATRGTPNDPNDIFDVLFNSFLRFSEKVFNSIESSPKKGNDWDIIPPFFIDVDLKSSVEPLSLNSTCETIFTIKNYSIVDDIHKSQNVSPIKNQMIIDTVDPVRNDFSVNPESPERLKEIYFSFIRNLYRSAEATYFLQPVDILACNVPDYFEIINEPMDLGTILKKMDGLGYKSHWEVIYDVNLVFDNAFMYNKKPTQVYKYAFKLSQKFNEFSSRIMKEAGYCCNKRYIFTPQPIYCNSSEFCVIKVNQHYYRYNDKIFYCAKCYDLLDECIENISEYAETKKILKREFELTRNNQTVYEQFVSCQLCRKQNHKVCVNIVDSIDGLFYYCNDCYKGLDIPRPENSFISSNLPECHLSSYIEKHVNAFLAKEVTNCKPIRIRMICNVEKTLMTKEGLHARLKNTFPSKFPYKSKALFAFQEVEYDKEVCFFSMHLQEYDDSCPQPNKRRVYLSYLDSVHYLQPKNYKTRVYHEILLSYLQFCKDRGFEYCHIWSCPPSEGDDYVFHCHSYEQKLPKPKRLLDWYKKMIELGIQKKIFIECKDIYQNFEGFVGDISTSIPYFEGDYWSNSLEDHIVEFENERDRDINKNNNSAVVLSEDIKSNRKSVNKKKSAGNKNLQQTEINLNQKLLSVMFKYKEVFFVIKLNESETNFIQDPDPIFQSELMEGRSGFLSLCRENNWEFSSFRHAIYSTKATLYVVHQQMYNFAEYCCDKCKRILVRGYHCDICTSDYDLCAVCHKRFTHEHNLTYKVYIDFDDKTIRHKPDPSPKSAGLDQYNSNQSHNKDSNERIIRTIIHSTSCIDNQCDVPCCKIMRKVLIHHNNCAVISRSSCSICEPLCMILYTHSKSCTSINCDLFSCSRLKSALRRNNQDNSKKIMSRINKMQAQLEYHCKDQEKEIEAQLTLRERKHKYTLQSSDEQDQPSKLSPVPIGNDPLFTIPQNNLPVDYALNSLKGNNTRSVINNHAPNSVSDVKLSTESRTHSRRGRKPNSNKMQNPREVNAPVDNSGSNNKSSFISSRLDQTPNVNHFKPNEISNRQTPVISPGQGLHPTLCNNIAQGEFNCNDGTLIRYPFIYQMAQPVSTNPNFGSNPIINRQGNRVGYSIRNFPGKDYRCAAPTVTPFNVNNSQTTEMFRANANIANIPGGQPIFLSNEFCGSRTNFQSPMVEGKAFINNANMTSTPTCINDIYESQVHNQQSMSTANVQNAGHAIQNNHRLYSNQAFINNQNSNPRAPASNIVYRSFLINPDMPMVPGNIQTIPNSNIVYNNTGTNYNAINNVNNYSLSQMNAITLQQSAMLNQNQSNRLQSIVINGADKQILPNTQLRGNFHQNGGYMSSNMPNNMNSNIHPRQISQPNTNPLYSYHVQPMTPNMNTHSMLNNYQLQNNPRPSTYIPNPSHHSNT